MASQYFHVLSGSRSDSQCTHGLLEVWSQYRIPNKVWLLPRLWITIVNANVLVDLLHADFQMWNGNSIGSYKRRYNIFFCAKMMYKDVHEDTKSGSLFEITERAFCEFWCSTIPKAYPWPLLGKLRVEWIARSTTWSVSSAIPSKIFWRFFDINRSILMLNYVKQDRARYQLDFSNWITASWYVLIPLWLPRISRDVYSTFEVVGPQ